MNSRRLSPGYQQQSQLLFERYQRGEISSQEHDAQKKQLADREIESTAQNQTVQARLAIQEFEVGQLSIWEQRQREQEKKKVRAEEKEQQRLVDQAESERLRAETEKLVQEERASLARAEVLRLETEKFAQEERTHLAEAKTKEDEQARQQTVNDQYVNTEVPTTLAEMRKGAKRNRGWSSFFQLIIIIVSTIAAGIVNIPNVPRLVISIMTITVAIVNGIVWIFKFKERSINSQQTADAIEHERNLYRLGIKDYADKTKDPLKAGQLLAERIEDLKNEQNKRQQLLEQTPGKTVETARASKTV